MSCWGCEAEVERGAPLCAGCGRPLPPAPGEDPFRALGLPRAYALPPERIATAFRERTRLVHPDRFARKGARERRAALERATFLADARRELADRWARAGRLLRLRGVDPAGAPRPGPAFLGAQMEARERLALARAKGGEARRNGEAAAAARAGEALAEIEAELGRLLDAESGDEGLAEAARRLGEARFWVALAADAAGGGLLLEGSLRAPGAGGGSEAGSVGGAAAEAGSGAEVGGAPRPDGGQGPGPGEGEGGGDP